MNLNKGRGWGVQPLAVDFVAPEGHTLLMILMVYVPCPNIEGARHIAHRLVEEKLAACCNILPAMESIYVWDSKLCEEKEVLLLAKTSKAQWPELRDRVKSLHPYETPAIVAYPSHDANTGYAAWVNEQLKRSPS